MSKASASPRLFWKIIGYKGLKPTFEKVLAAGSLTEKQMTTVLQRLVSRTLNENETIAASLRRSSKGYAPDLEPNIDSGPRRRYSISVGSNPYYVASMWKDSELDERRDRLVKGPRGEKRPAM